jgi:MFS family permease
MGAGEGLAFPALYDLISRWAPPLERARSFGVVQLGVKAGTTLALALGPAVIRAAGWEVGPPP